MKRSTIINFRFLLVGFYSLITKGSGMERLSMVMEYLHRQSDERNTSQK